MKLIQSVRDKADHATPAPFRLAPRVEGEITLRRLQIFWAIARTSSLTKAAKLLSVSQPSLSQQLAALETTVGTRLFERRANSLVLTEVGEAILVKAEDVLRSVQELEDSLPGTGTSRRATIRVAGVASVLRAILPGALHALRESHPHVDLDLHEAAPAEILDLLHGRRVNLGLVPANAVAESSAGFQSHLVAEDPYVLVTPEPLDLGGVGDPARDLSPADHALLGSTIHFVFGNQHSRLIQDWYDRVLPGNRLAAQARSFETVIEMVRSGFGVCVAPALSTLGGAAPLPGLRLYRTGLEPRRIVALLPAHCRRIDPYPQLVEGLVAAGRDLRLPPIRLMPPFVAQRIEAGGPFPGRPPA